MMSESAPPPYVNSASENPSESHKDAKPPAYNFPKTFTIGSQRTSAPFVSSAELKGHLALLHSFAALRAEIDELDESAESAIPLIPQDKERRWAWFVGLAVERFSTWCSSIEMNDIYDKLLEDILPPIDVIMVWHSYMLNPGWYAEDTVRLQSLAPLKEIGKVFARYLHRLSAVVTSEPSAARTKAWNGRTSREFNYLEDAVRQKTKTIHCPYCQQQIEAPLMTSEGQGYLQQNFGILCPNFQCAFGKTITKDILGIDKLSRDLVRNDTAPGSYLAGTLHTSESGIDLERAQRIKSVILTAHRFARAPDITQEHWRMQIMGRHEHSPQRLQTTISIKLSRGRLSQRIFGAYLDDQMFSVQLVGAVLRQGSFVKKMYELQWTQPGFFNSKEDEVALQHAIARYHAFLDLMTSSTGSFFVPTLDIDLAWHTHQLMGEAYSEDCKTYVGRFIDHDDKIEESTLAGAFDITCRAWKDRFGVPYTHCGCPLPGETIGQKLSRLIGSYGSSPSYLVPPDREDLLAATHPSDHNAVFAYHRKNSSEKSQAYRRRKFAKRLQRDRELVKEGKLDPKRAKRSLGHDPAFLVPVPIFFMYGPMMTACAAGTGSVVNNGGSGGAVCAPVGITIAPTWQGHTNSVFKGAGACGSGGGCGSSSGGCGGGGGGGGGCGGGGGGGGCGGGGGGGGGGCGGGGGGGGGGGCGGGGGG